MSPSPSLIYLDHHATTPLDPEVFAAMQPFWMDSFGNPASTSHRAGSRAANAVRLARQLIADSLNCDPMEIIFTSGATEANNLAIKGALAAAETVEGRRQLIVNAGEHRSVLDVAKRRQREGGAVDVLPINHAGRVDPDQVRVAVSTHTTLLSVMHANNEVGSINDIAAIGEICRERHVRFHVDAAQTLGKLPIDLHQLPLDLLSATAHKLGGPPGVGLLFVRRNSRFPPLQPLFEGGGHERGLRSGTLPVPLIVGFARAVELAVANRAVETTRLAQLRDDLWRQLQQAVPGILRNSPIDALLPHNLNVRIPRIDGDVLLARLKLSNLCVSSGSACTSANPQPSHVLRAMGLSDADARSSLRFGLGRTTTSTEILAAVAVLREVLGTSTTAPISAS